MPSDLKKFLVVTAIGVSLAVAALAPVVAQDTLPPGPGAEETMKACGGCHGILQIFGLQRPAEEWSSTVTAMINFGAPVGEGDFNTVVNYLATYFGPSPPPVSAPAPAPSP